MSGDDCLRTRPASLGDAAWLAEFGARSFVAAFGPSNDPADIEAYVVEAFSLEQMVAELRRPGSHFLLAYDDSTGRSPVAYARLQVGSADPAVVAERPAEIVRIYTDPERIGFGYGSSLLRACVAAAADANCDVVWLGVWEHNTAARRLYERWDFRVVGKHPFLLGSDEQTDLVMARPVDTPASLGAGCSG